MDLALLKEVTSISISQSALKPALDKGGVTSSEAGLSDYRAGIVDRISGSIYRGFKRVLTRKPVDSTRKRVTAFFFR